MVYLKRYDIYCDDTKRKEYYEKIWNEYYQRLLDYYVMFNTANVPRNYVTDDGYRLGNWVYYQRSKFHNGTLAETQKELLDKANMIWNLRDEKWDIGYAKLVDYYETHGNIDIVPSYVTDDGYNLGAWLLSFKQTYKGKGKRKLDHDQIAMFNDLFIDWSKNDTKVLNSEIVKGCCFNKYKKIMLERMKHILDDLSYEIGGTFTSKDNQKYFEDEIIKRMWR